MKRRIFRSTPNLDQLLTENNKETQLSVLPKIIETGAEGNIFLAQLLRNDQSPLFFAAKKRPLYNFASGDTAEHERRMHYTASLRRQRSNQQLGILPFMGSFVTTNAINRPETYHAMPLAEAVLNHCIPTIIALKKTNKTLYHVIIHDVLCCMLNGLEQLSKTKIVHNDLSASNILLYKQRWVISDFGQAEEYAEFSSPDSRPRGSALNMPPEILNNDKRFPLARDIWALGLILKELMDEMPGFHNTEPKSNLRALMQVKKTGYQQLRQARIQSEQLDKDHQLSLRWRILLLTTPEDCLSLFVNSMLEILPERRPNLTTFQIACDHFLQLLPEVSSIESTLAEFYTSIQNEKLVVIHPDASPDSELIDDEIECEVVNLSLNSSARCSPVV